ncbi:hypothetical protein WA026_013443, partial [Henosepilachna vigintioctopunctata]
MKKFKKCNGCIPISNDVQIEIDKLSKIIAEKNGIIKDKDDILQYMTDKVLLLEQQRNQIDAKIHMLTQEVSHLTNMLDTNNKYMRNIEYKTNEINEKILQFEEQERKKSVLKALKWLDISD